MRIAPLGVPLRFHWSLLFLLGLFVMQMGVLGFMFFTLLSFSILFHEYSHIWIAKKCGLTCKEVIYFGLGAGAMMENLGEPKTELKVALAGPVSSLVLALVFLPLAIWKPTVIAFVYMVSMNVVLAVFNALPIYPMDGGRVFYAILTFFMKKMTALKVAVWVSNILSVAAIALCVMHQLWFMAVVFLFLLLSSRAIKHRDGEPINIFPRGSRFLTVKRSFESSRKNSKNPFWPLFPQDLSILQHYDRGVSLPRICGGEHEGLPHRDPHRECHRHLPLGTRQGCPEEDQGTHRRASSLTGSSAKMPSGTAAWLRP